MTFLDQALARVHCDRERVCPQCSVSVPWALGPSDATSAMASAASSLLVSRSSDVLTVFLTDCSLGSYLHSVSWSHLHFKRNQRLKVEGRWGPRHSGRSGTRDWMEWESCAKTGTPRGQGRLGPKTPSSSS